MHLYGHPADMDAIRQVVAVHGLWVIEDAAEAHTARYKGRPVRSLGRAAAFSFYGNKIFSCGEGGAVTVDDEHLEIRMRMLRGQGMDPARRYWFPVIGYNYRLSNLACALLCAQLERREQILARRRRIFALYRGLLEGIPGIGLPPSAPWAEPAPWVFSITVDERRYGLDRDQLAARLEAVGVETRPFFVPLHQLPPYRPESLGRCECLPVSEWLGRSGLSLPVHSGMTEADVERIAAAVRTGCRAVGVLHPVGV
ncbi:MAG: DegT/DnrJ/EryC1/StrS family aminotransferase [Bryobacteraceae bacterium]